MDNVSSVLQLPGWNLQHRRSASARLKFLPNFTGFLVTVGGISEDRCWFDQQLRVAIKLITPESVRQLILLERKRY